MLFKFEEIKELMDEISSGLEDLKKAKQDLIDSIKPIENE